MTDPIYNRVQAVDNILVDKLCKFHENLTTNALRKQEMQIFNLKWLLFPY